ncbi:MAG: cation transporter [Lewinella sp.]|nr:cation transporter [Lewinella sp.]
MTASGQNLKFQQIITFTSVILFGIKISAWYMTGSVSILTDALESTVNIFTAFLGLYSLYLSAKPRDENHPYGHGKIEFISAAIEGVLISVAGLIIVYEAIINLRHPHALQQLDFGILLISATAAVNYLVGFWAVRLGGRNKSPALVSSGKHLQSDTYSTVGIIVGLLLIRITGIAWLDSAVALLFAGIIMVMGYGIIRSSLAGIMDEADEELLREIVAVLQENRQENWIDLHNLRVIKYGSVLHMDCHLTAPWYFNVHQSHEQVDKLGRLVRDNFGDNVELFVHTDGCLPFSCKICSKQDCPVRQSDFVARIEWTVGNISADNKHRID